MRNIIRFDLSLAPIYYTEQFVFGILNALFEFKSIYVVFVIINPGSLNKKILNLEILFLRIIKVRPHLKHFVSQNQFLF